mgnify:CR=1 FL=1
MERIVKEGSASKHLYCKLSGGRTGLASWRSTAPVSLSLRRHGHGTNLAAPSVHLLKESRRRIVTLTGGCSQCQEDEEIERYCADTGFKELLQCTTNSEHATDWPVSGRRGFGPGTLPNAGPAARDC